MRTFFSRTAFAALTIALAFGFAIPALAADPYADSVGGSSGVDNPGEALGAPDSTEAGFADEDDWITLNMAPGEHGVGDLVIYYDAGQDVDIRLDIYNLSGGTVAESIPVTLNDYYSSLEVNVNTEEYNSVRLTLLEDVAWGLDAIESEDTVEEEETEDTDSDDDGLPDYWEDAHDLDAEDEDDAEEDPDDDGLTNVDEYEANTNPQSPDTDGDGTQDGEEVEEGTDPLDSQDAPGLDVEAGDLIKTATSSAVYLVGSDGKRHAFPNETIYYSWFENFDDVAEVGFGTMASYTLGYNVTMRPGTWLVKIQSVATVYAVEPGGALRAIPDEDTAQELYGEDWAERAADIADAFWTNYEVGDEIEDAHPDGTLIQASDGTVYYIEDEEKREVDDDAFGEWGFQEEFVLDDEELEDPDQALEAYETGSDFGTSTDEEVKWAY
jgi:hypothetical protein